MPTHLFLMYTSIFVVSAITETSCIICFVNSCVYVWYLFCYQTASACVVKEDPAATHGHRKFAQTVLHKQNNLQSAHLCNALNSVHR